MRQAALPVALLCALVLGACGNTLQDQPIPHNTLESLVENPFPVYWLGGSFHGLSVTEASQDGSGALTVQYGDCLEGGQGVCVPPLRIVTSADNSFLPGEAAGGHRTTIRGVPALVTSQGRTILMQTGPVVVGIYAQTPSLARAAAASMVPINEPGVPRAPLPAPQLSSGYSETPLPWQEPQPLHPVR